MITPTLWSILDEQQATAATARVETIIRILNQDRLLPDDPVQMLFRAEMVNGQIVPAAILLRDTQGFYIEPDGEELLTISEAAEAFNIGPHELADLWWRCCSGETEGYERVIVLHQIDQIKTRPF